MIKTIKLEKLIQELQKIKEIFGDIPVVLSRDEEGNGFGTMDPGNNFSTTSVAVDNGILILYPFLEHIELEEIVR